MDKCLVCVKAGGNLNIFTTYNVCGEREELYAEVIKNCFNIQIPPDAGLVTMCIECSLKLRKAYNFKLSIDEAVSKLLAARVTAESIEDKFYSQADYLEDVAFDEDYDINTVLNPQTGQISYTLHRINDMDTTKIDQNYLIELDNLILDKEVGEEDERQNDEDMPLNTEAQLYKLHEVNEAVNADTINLIHDNINVKLGNEKDVKSIISHDATILHLETGQIYNLGKADEKEENPSQNILTDLDGKVVENNELSKSVVSKKFMKKIKIIKKGVKHGNKELVKDNLPDNVKKINIIRNEIIKDANAVIIKENRPKNVEKIEIEKIGETINEKYLLSHWDTISKITEIVPGNNEINDLEQIVTNDMKGEMVKEIIPSNDEKIKVKKAVPKRLKEKVVKENVLGDGEKKPIDMGTGKVKKTKLTRKGVKDVKDGMVEGNVEKKKKTRKSRKKPPPPPCEQCGAQLATHRARAAHAHTHATHACGACGLVLATRDKLRAHARTHDQGPFVCRYCSKEFTNINTRNAHEWRVHSKQDPFKCSQCDERFKTFLKRLRHMQAAHSAKEEYPCHYCKRTFAYAAYRTRHIRIMHHKERPHQCPECPSAFAKRGALRAHLATKHGVGEMRHQCTACFRRFPVRSALLAHASTHVERFSCIHCEQKFKRSIDLESHIKTHECGEGINMSLDFVTSLHLDDLPEDYAFLDPAYLDLNEL